MAAGPPWMPLPMSQNYVEMQWVPAWLPVPVMRPVAPVPAHHLNHHYDMHDLVDEGGGGALLDNAIEERFDHLVIAEVATNENVAEQQQQQKEIPPVV